MIGIMESGPERYKHRPGEREPQKGNARKVTFE